MLVLTLTSVAATNNADLSIMWIGSVKVQLISVHRNVALVNIEGDEVESGLVRLNVNDREEWNEGDSPVSLKLIKTGGVTKARLGITASMDIPVCRGDI